MRRAFAIGIAVMALAAVAQNKPYITRIFDFRPAPGQYVGVIECRHDVEQHPVQAVVVVAVGL